MMIDYFSQRLTSLWLGLIEFNLAACPVVASLQGVLAPASIDKIVST
jgi:hypothetical protein